MDLAVAQRLCVTDPVSGLKHMPAQEAEELFRAFEQPNGTIVIQEERDAGIEHVWYSGKEVLADPVGYSIVQLHLEYGPSARSQFTSLSDLNGATVIAYIQATIPDPIVASLSGQLASAAGIQKIRFPVSFHELGNSRRLTGSRYVGICIPNDYFDVFRNRK